MHEPLPASTIIICRITRKWPHKILLIKRSEQAKFLPGAHVFPGGRCEAKDEALGAWLAADVGNFQRIRAYFPEDHNAATHLAAAIRETFEETSLSILATTNGILPPEGLADLLANSCADAIKPDLSKMWPISWWITPMGEVRRFNAWFFLTLIEDTPALDRLVGDNEEGVNDLRWLTPEDALAAYARREVFLAPPTRSILERMASTNNLEDFLTFVDRPLRPICPFFADVGDEKILILPGDPLHHEQQRPIFLPQTRYSFP